MAAIAEIDLLFSSSFFALVRFIVFWRGQISNIESLIYLNNEEPKMNAYINTYTYYYTYIEIMKLSVRVKDRD